MTRLIGKLSKLSKYSASWSIVCTRLQTQAHVVILLTLGELNKQQSQPTSKEAGEIALLRPPKRPKEGEALQEHRSACGYDERIVRRRRRGLRLRLANCCGRPLEMLEVGDNFQHRGVHDRHRCPRSDVRSSVLVAVGVVAL